MSPAKELPDGMLAAMVALTVISFSLGAAAATKTRPSPRTADTPPQAAPLERDAGVTEAATDAVRWMTAGTKRWRQASQAIVLVE